METCSRAFVRMNSLQLRCWILINMQFMKKVPTNDCCYISLKQLKDLSYVVQASDGNLYDVAHLWKWGKECDESERSFCVIPGLPIESVTLVEPIDEFTPLALTEAKTFEHKGIQVNLMPSVRQQARIPSQCSAFTPFRKRV